MALNDKLTDIADAIREKTAISDSLSLEQMVLDINSLQAPIGDVPSYVTNEAIRVANAVTPLLPSNGL